MDRSYPETYNYYSSVLMLPKITVVPFLSRFNGKGKLINMAVFGVEGWEDKAYAMRVSHTGDILVKTQETRILSLTEQQFH